MSKFSDKFKKDDNVISQYEKNFSSYTDKENEDNFIEVVDVQNGTQTAIIAYKGCSRYGIWLWDSTFVETLEEMIEKVIEEVY